MSVVFNGHSVVCVRFGLTTDSKRTLATTSSPAHGVYTGGWTRDLFLLKDPTLMKGSVNGKRVKDSCQCGVSQVRLARIYTAGSFQGSRYAGSINWFGLVSLVTRMAAGSHSNTLRVRKASVPSSASSVR